MDLSDLRRDYALSRLDESDLDPDPIAQFRRWYEQAAASGEPEPNAMTLASVGPNGQPSARIVLLRGLDARGFAFFTNYDSRKGRDLAANPRAALLFFWPRLERQVRVEGRTELVPEEESDRYFATRPRGSRIGAWASPQSQPIPDRDALAALFQACDERFADQAEIPRPPNWGGFRVVPDAIEFWQGGADRLHDRLQYRRDPDGAWIIERLAP